MEAPPGIREENHRALTGICVAWRSGGQTDAKLVSMGEECLRILAIIGWANERLLPNETVAFLAFSRPMQSLI